MVSPAADSGHADGGDDFHPPDDAVVTLAADLLAEALRAERVAPRSVRTRRRRMAALVDDADAKALTVALTDEVLRVDDPRVASRRFRELVAATDLSGLPYLDRVQLRVGAAVSRALPQLVMPLVSDRLRRESSAMIIDAADPRFERHVARRRADGFVVNVNVLGEAVLGDGEARRRLDLVLARIARPDVDYVSVKISAICATVSALAFDETIDTVAERLRTLYRAAMARTPHVFVNLDMEEFRDLALTVAVFRTVLDEPEFVGYRAGIVMQAYLPDTHDVARELAEWAVARRASGGAPIKVRVVKGANLAMERVEAEVRGWPLAPYPTKQDTDASFQRLIDTLLDARYDDAVEIGLASHNLFDLARGLLLRAQLAGRDAAERLSIEMLEGMATAQADAISRRAPGIAMYTPVVDRHDFTAAIAYLVRRLDENTEPGNFLTDLFSIEPGNATFARQAAAYRAAATRRADVSTALRRLLARTDELPTPSFDVGFHNEADTDFAVAANRAWIRRHLAEWRPPSGPVQAVIDGAVVPRGAATTVADIALPASPFGSYQVEQAGPADARRAVAVARRVQAAWAARPPAERAAIIDRVGDVVAARRGAILATMAHDAGKTIGEGDPEVSEAVDFARFYARSSLEVWRWADGSPGSTTDRPLGTVVVAPPWNFPYAIPIGGVLAALAAGNAVILKPAPQTTLTARLVAEHCWAAGVPNDVLQFVPCPDDATGQLLITHPDVDAVVLTGAHATARMFLGWRPDLRLHAETSGKNAMIITASADLDLAIAHLVRSAFGHAGQKCSAASLGILEAPLYDDPRVLARIADAARTLRVGPGCELGTDVGPLIDPPGESLERALTRLDEGEQWLVEPQCRSADRRSWTPGVRLGVRPGSWLARTEVFGPVLGLIRAADLDDAIAIANDTDYGLTAGLHSLSEGDIDRWCAEMNAGNLYVNRGTTGAIVRRQPFGGWKHSVVGPTVKAGGRLYVASLQRWEPAASAPPAESDEHAARFADAAARWAARWMGDGEDPSALHAESNRTRHRPLPSGVVLRVGAGAPAQSERWARIAAAATGCPLVVSRASEEDDEAFASRLVQSPADRLRVVGNTSLAVRAAAHAMCLPVYDDPVVALADVELPRWTREQAISRTEHRHGHVRQPREPGAPT